jgi:hypothetical protein
MLADNWCVKVNEKVYGPYSSAQLKKFARDGRFAAWSLIAPAGSRSWREAREEQNFSSFFGAATENASSFGRKVDARSAPASAESARAAEPRKPRRPTPFASAPSVEGTSGSGPANFILIFDVVSASASRVDSALTKLGPAFRLADNVWTVSCALTAIGVRNAVAPFLRPNEPLFVVDATNGRTSWQNYAPEPHAKIAASFMRTRLAPGE